jgi:hypothetical protein
MKKIIYNPQTDIHFNAIEINGSVLVQTILTEEKLNILILNGFFDEILEG